VATNSSIEWTQTTWNPVTGCDRLATGCDYCYALARPDPGPKSQPIHDWGQGDTRRGAMRACHTARTTRVPRTPSRAPDIPGRFSPRCRGGNDRPIWLGYATTEAAVVAPPVASEGSDRFRNNEDVTVRRRSQCPHR
jgi:hypothetical protein